jgi:hypothetical protein
MNEKNLSCWKSQVRLASEMGLSRSSVCKAIQSLQKKNIIMVKKKTRKVGFDSNEYSFRYPWDKSICDNIATARKRNKGMSPKNTNACMLDIHMYVGENDTNKSSRNELKESNHLQYSGVDDDCAFKHQPADPLAIDNEGEFSGKDIAEDFVLPPGSPPVAAKSDLQCCYGRWIPASIDLTHSSRGRRIDLMMYIAPFRLKRELLQEKYGKDYDIPQEKLWEDQCHDYYEKVINTHWNQKGEKPLGGFEKIFKRACRAGVMYRCGFRPKSLDIIEAENKEKLRCKEERILNEKKRLKKELKEKEKRKLMAEKDLKLQNLIYQDESLYLYLINKQLISEKGDMCLDEIKNHIREIRDMHDIQDIESLISFCGKELFKIQSMQIRKQRRKIVSKEIIGNNNLCHFFVQERLFTNASIPVLLYDGELDQCVEFVENIQREFQIEFGEALDRISKRSAKKRVSEDAGQRHRQR